MQPVGCSTEMITGNVSKLNLERVGEIWPVLSRIESLPKTDGLICLEHVRQRTYFSALRRFAETLDLIDSHKRPSDFLTLRVWVNGFPFFTQDKRPSERVFILFGTKEHERVIAGISLP